MRSKGALGTPSACAPLFSTRALTEEELFQRGYESYLPISLSSDGTRNDPRDHLFDSIPEPFIESDEYQRTLGGLALRTGEG